MKAESIFMRDDVRVYDAEQKIVSKYQLSIIRLHSSSRKAPLVVARALLMTYFHNQLGYSLTEVGRYFNRNHSTAIHSIKLISVEGRLKQLYEENFGKLNIIA